MMVRITASGNKIADVVLKKDYRSIFNINMQKLKMLYKRNISKVTRLSIDQPPVLESHNNYLATEE